MKKHERFMVVEMGGSHYEMGRQYGSQCREQIRRLAGIFDGLMLKEKNFAKGRAIAAEAVPQVRAAAPELLEEVEGIAAGAGLSFDEVFRLNCSVELFSWQGCMDKREVSTVSDGCSSFAVRAKEGTLVAWNMDWWRLWLPYIVLLRGAPKGGPRFMAFAFAGCVGRPGMSEHVAASANFLPYRAGQDAAKTGEEWAGPGVPYNFLSRIMLKQKSTQDAVAAAARVKRMACINYTVGDAQGDICCIETTPNDYDVLSPQEEFIVHANSYHSPKYGGLSEKDQEKHDPRAFHARRLLRQHRDRLDRHALASVQTSHFPRQPTGVCVHQKLQDRDGITLLSFIARVGAGEMWAACGPPCEHEFIRYWLPE